MRSVVLAVVVVALDGEEEEYVELCVLVVCVFRFRLVCCMWGREGDSGTEMVVFEGGANAASRVVLNQSVIADENEKL